MSRKLRFVKDIKLSARVMHMGDLYIAYAYRSHANTPSKYIIGVYFTLEEARTRLLNFEPPSSGIAHEPYNHHVSFINKVPQGDCYVEMFTTRVW